MPAARQVRTVEIVPEDLKVEVGALQAKIATLRAEHRELNAFADLSTAVVEKRLQLEDAIAAVSEKEEDAKGIITTCYLEVEQRRVTMEETLQEERAALAEASRETTAGFERQTAELTVRKRNADDLAGELRQQETENRDKEAKLFHLGGTLTEQRSELELEKGMLAGQRQGIARDSETVRIHAAKAAKHEERNREHHQNLARQADVLHERGTKLVQEEQRITARCDELVRVEHRMRGDRTVIENARRKLATRVSELIGSQKKHEREKADLALRAKRVNDINEELKNRERRLLTLEAKIRAERQRVEEIKEDVRRSIMQQEQQLKELRQLKGGHHARR